MSDFGIDHLVMPMCTVVSCVVERRCLLWPVHSLGKTLLAFALLHFVLQGQICLLLQVSLDFPLLHSSPLWSKECPTLGNPMDCSLPGSSVHGIFQAIVLEWIGISFSRGSSQPRDLTCIFCIGRWILYPWATWEAENITVSVIWI